MQHKCSTCTPQHITKTYFWVKVYVGVSWTLRFRIRLFSFDRKVERYRLMFLQQTNGSSRTLNPSHLKVLREILCCIFLHARLWFVLSWELIFMIDWNDYFGLRQCWWGFYNRKIDVHWRLQWELLSFGLFIQRLGQQHSFETLHWSALGLWRGVSRQKECHRTGHAKTLCLAISNFFQFSWELAFTL